MENLCRNAEEHVLLDSSIRELGIKIAYEIYWGPPIGVLDPKLLDEEVNTLLSELRNRFTLDRLKENNIIRAYRDFYWRIGIDPTKTRPSSEALVRRALRGKWPRINPIVDIGNIVSAKYLVPIGIYDLSKAVLPFLLTMSRGGEKFVPIGGKEEVVDEKLPILVDSKGILLHIYPHRDSALTMTDNETSHILVVAAGVPLVPSEILVNAVREFTKLVSAYGWKSCRYIVMK